MKNCSSVFSDYETCLSTCDRLQLQKLNKFKMCSLTRVTVFYHINVNVCLNCLFIVLLLFVKINLTKDCSAVCHTCFVVVNSIASLSRGILFRHQFPTHMFCSTAISWDKLVSFSLKQWHTKVPCRPFSTVVLEGRVHKHIEYENLLWVLQTIFHSFDRRQYAGYLLWELGVTSLIVTGELQLACCCGEQLSTLLLASVICM
jgi:hypothetical protein